MPRGAVRVRAVLDEPQIVARTQFGERVEVGGGAGDVHRDDGPGPLGDRRLGGDGVDAQRVSVDVDEHRGGVHGEDGAGRRHEGHRRHDHLVALTDVARGERGFERVGAVREGQPERGAVEVGELRGEGGRLVAIALPPTTGIEDAEQAVAFTVVPDRPGRIVVLPDGSAAEHGRQVERGDGHRDPTVLATLRRSLRRRATRTINWHWW
jgi:hypothetical protein